MTKPQPRSTHDLTITGAALYGTPAPLFLRYSVASGTHREHEFDLDISGATVIISLRRDGTTARTMTVPLAAIVEPALNIMIDDLGG